jgi:hypothetical protein
VFPIDVWTGTAWVDQGTVYLERAGAVLDTLVSSAVLEYTPERAVLKLVLTKASDAFSRETVIVTLQRGWSGPRFEVYLSPLSNGAAADGGVGFETAFADANQSVLKIEASNTSVMLSSATSFPGATFGASFNGESWYTLLRQAASPAFTPTLSVLQTNVQAWTSSDASYGYGTRNSLLLVSTGGQGYISAQLGFYLEDVQQTMEAEAMTLGTGTTGNVSDGAASGGLTTTATRTTDANPHVTKVNWLTGIGGMSKLRVFARVKTTAGTLSVYAKTSDTTGATKTTTSTSYVWVDLGDIACSFGNETLEIHAWTSSGTLSVDRIEAFCLERRNSVVTYDGARDQGQAALTDSRQIPTITTR